jgi:DNA polymerase-3 subunit gamma/tau
MSAEDAQLFYQIAINGKRDMAYVPDPRGGLEMLLLRMIAFRPAAVIDASLTAEDLKPVDPPATSAAAEVGPETTKKPAEAAGRLASAAPGPVPAADPGPDPVAPAAIEEREPAQQPVSTACSDASDIAPHKWPQLLDRLGLLGMVYNIASNCQLLAVDGDSLSFVLDEGNASLFNDGHRDKIRLALQNYFDRPLSVAIEVGTPPGETPAMLRARAARERQAEAVAEIERDERLQQLLARFDGELDLGSIAPMDS